MDLTALKPMSYEARSHPTRNVRNVWVLQN